MYGELGALKAAALTRSQLGRVNLITIGLIGKQVRRVHDAGIDVAARRLGGKTLGNRIERRQALEYATVTMRGQQLVLACEQARQIVMGTQDVERIGWMLGNLCHGSDRCGVDHAVEELCEQRHQEHRDGAGGNHDRRNILRQRARVDGNARHGNDNRQRRGAVQGHGNATIRRNVARRRTNAHRDENGHGANDQQRHDKAREQPGARRHGRQVDLCARYSKEHRNQKTVGQAVELGLERMVALGDDIA